MWGVVKEAAFSILTYVFNMALVKDSLYEDGRRLGLCYSKFRQANRPAILLPTTTSTWNYQEDLRADGFR